MLFLRCAKNNHPLCFLIQRITTKPFERKTHTKFLGVYEDENFKWKDHVFT